MDASAYEDGNGSVRVRARIEQGSDETLVIKELPYGASTESVISSIEEAARKKKVPVKSINDYTSEKVEIELCLVDGTNPDKAIKAIYAFTSCESALSSNIVVISGKRPVKMTVSEVIKANTRHFLKVLKAELTHRRNQLLDEFHARTLTRIFIEERIYKKIEQCKTQEAVFDAVMKGLAPFRKELKRDVVKKDVETLLGIKIRRISLFDINRNKKEIEVILAELDKVNKNLENLTAYSIRTLNGLIKKYSEDYPRRTEITKFGTVEIKALTADELDISYNKTTGYIGHKVKGDLLLQCSSYDKLMVFWKDGRYRAVNPPDKMFVDKNMLYCDTFDRERVMTVVYTHEEITYLKRFKTGGTILNKDYLCTLADSKIILLQEGTPDNIYLKYKPSKGQRIHQQVFCPGDVPVKGAKARGNTMTSKAIAKIAVRKPRWWDKDHKSPRGVMMG